MKNKKQLLLKLLSISLIMACIIAFTILQGYWALWEYRTAPSSGCLDCDIFSDLLLSAVLPVLAIGILHLVYRWTNPGLFRKTIFCVGVLMLCWYVIDTVIFDEREASWSTYTNIWSVGLGLCILQICTFGLLFGVIYPVLCFKKE